MMYLLYTTERLECIEYEKYCDENVADKVEFVGRYNAS
jgi:hypothetical protein